MIPLPRAARAAADTSSQEAFAVQGGHDKIDNIGYQ